MLAHLCVVAVMSTESWDAWLSLKSLNWIKRASRIWYYWKIIDMLLSACTVGSKILIEANTFFSWFIFYILSPLFEGFLKKGTESSHFLSNLIVEYRVMTETQTGPGQSWLLKYHFSRGFVSCREEVFQVEWDPNHETVLASSADDRRLMVWDLNRYFTRRNFSWKSTRFICFSLFTRLHYIYICISLCCFIYDTFECPKDEKNPTFFFIFF